MAGATASKLWKTGNRMMTMDRFDCEHVFKRLDDYLDRELTPEEIQLIEEHLKICAWCASTYAFQENVLQEMRTKLQRVSAPAQLRNKVAAALKKARQEMTD
jgi:anti-sigma factor (TIGR02949 family)